MVIVSINLHRKPFLDLINSIKHFCAHLFFPLLIYYTYRFRDCRYSSFCPLEKKYHDTFSISLKFCLIIRFRCSHNFSIFYETAKFRITHWANPFALLPTLQMNDLFQLKSLNQTTYQTVMPF